MKKVVRVLVLLVGFVLGSCGNTFSTVETPELSVHFLELGNQYTGDSVFIDYGNTEILIDAGSKFESAATIRAFIGPKIEDGKLEFVIATHAHEDHIGALADYYFNGSPGILSSYAIGTIIDFPNTEKVRDAQGSGIYTSYVEARDKAVDKGAKHYTALQCYNNESPAQRVYELGGSVTLEVLYNYYYDHKGPPNSASDSTIDENHYSVCVMLHNGKQQYLFTGDMEAAGEEKLVAHYATLRGGLGHCVLFKGAHHGSNTSNSPALLNAITPDYVCICTCCGSSEYTPNIGGQFPTQTTINNIAKHTDKVFATTLVTTFSETKDEAVYESMNGNIEFAAAPDGAIIVTGSNNSTLLKDTDWFKENRTMPDTWK